MHRAVLLGALALFACGRSQPASSNASPGVAPRSSPPSWIAITVDQPGASAAQAEGVAQAIEHAAASLGAVEHVYGELDDAGSTTWVAIARMRCVGVVVDTVTAERVDLDALGRALALEPGETVLRLPMPPR